MTKDEILADARLKWGRLKLTDAAATLHRVEYACALVAVRDSRAYLGDGCEDFFSWVLRETGLQQAQARNYLAAAQVPRELVAGRQFGWHELALLGRVCEWPDAQRVLADGIERLGLAAARQAVQAPLCAANLARSSDERFTAKLVKELEKAAQQKERERPTPRGTAVQRNTRVLFSALARFGAGEPLSPEDQQVLVTLGQVINSLPLQGTKAPPEGVLAAARAQFGTRVPQNEKLNYSRNEGGKLRGSEGAGSVRDLDAGEAPGWAEVCKLEGAAARPRPARLDDEPHDGPDEKPDDEPDEKPDDQKADGAAPPSGGASAAGEAPDDAGAAAGDAGAGEPTGASMETAGAAKPPVEGPAALEPTAVVDALLRADEAQRPALYNAIEALLGEDNPEWQEISVAVLLDLADAAAPLDVLPPGALAAWVEQATDPDLFRRWEVLFPLLLSLDDDPGLPEVLWALHKGASLPAPLRAQAGAASARYPFPPLPDEATDPEAYAKLVAEIDARIATLKAATARPSYR